MLLGLLMQKACLEDQKKRKARRTLRKDIQYQMGLLPNIQIQRLVVLEKITFSFRFRPFLLLHCRQKLIFSSFYVTLYTLVCISSFVKIYIFTICTYFVDLQ